jgi:hypothetical protein
MYVTLCIIITSDTQRILLRFAHEHVSLMLHAQNLIFFSYALESIYFVIVAECKKDQIVKIDLNIFRRMVAKTDAVSSMQARTHTHSHMHTCTYTHTQAHTNTHSLTHIHTHTHTVTHSITRTHTHTLSHTIHTSSCTLK